MSVFSIIVVLLNLKKNRSKVLVPKIVIMASMVFVLYMCQNFNCRITGSRFLVIMC